MAAESRTGTAANGEASDGLACRELERQQRPAEVWQVTRSKDGLVRQ